MLDWALPVPATLHLESAERERLGLPPGPLDLVRVWPRGGGHLPLQYVAADGGSIAGQWFADLDQLERIARQTAQASPAPSAAVPGSGVLLQDRGADRRLLALAPLVAGEGATLVGHRAERSAVVRLQAVEGARYAKVVRTKLVEGIAAQSRVAQRLSGAAFATPRVLEVDPAAGVVVMSGLAGVRLHDLFGTDRLLPAMRAVGKALRALHGATPPGRPGRHSPVQGSLGLGFYLDRLAVFVPDLHRAVCAAAPAVAAALAAGSSPPALLHGDFSDKQVLVDDAGRVGIVDFQTLAVGEAAHDVANAIVKFEMRAMRGLCTPHQAEEAIAAFLAGYHPPRHVRSRLNAHADAARLRLACLNAFRPAWAREVPAMLLDRLGVAYGDCSAIRAVLIIPAAGIGVDPPPAAGLGVPPPPPAPLGTSPPTAAAVGHQPPPQR